MLAGDSARLFGSVAKDYGDESHRYDYRDSDNHDDPVRFERGPLTAKKRPRKRARLR